MDSATAIPIDAPGITTGLNVTATGDLNPPMARFRERFSWALYDFANTVFSMNIATLYFAAWLIADLGHSNTLYASVNGIASAMVVVSIPVFGAISDATQRRKPWVVGFTLIACIATALIAVLGQFGLPVIGEGVTGSAATSQVSSGVALFGVLAAFTIANYTYQGAQPFYNAMMPELVPVDHRGRLSGLGAALGYVGSITGVILTFPFFTGSMPIIGAVPEKVVRFLRTAVPFTGHGGRVSTFVPTAILFLLFSLPLFIFCRDHNPAPKGTPIDWKRAVRDVKQTIHDARQHPGALRFILASFVYQDAIGTIVGFMTLYAVKAVGFDKGSEITLFLVLTVPSIFGSFIYGHLVDRYGPKRSLMGTLILWIVLLTIMILVPGKQAFWFVGLAIGLNFGGVPTAERPVLLGLVPDVEAGRYFSLMLLASRAAAVLGPLIWGLTVDGLESRLGTAIAYRAAVMTVALMFVISILI